MDPVVIAILVGVAVVTIGGIIFVIRAVRRHKQSLASMTQRLGGLVPDQFKQAEEGGVSYSYGYFTAKDKKPAYLEVVVDSASELDFSIAAQSWFDRLGQAVGLTLKVPTNDPDFDGRFFISTDAPRSLRRALEGDQASRRAVLDIFEAGFKEIKLKDGTLTARWTGFQPSEETDFAMISETALRLAFIARAMPADIIDPDPPSPLGRAAFFVLLAILGIPGLTLVFVSPFPVLDVGDLFFASLAVSVPALLVFLVSAYFIFRGRTKSHTEFAFLLLFALPVFPLFGHQAISFLNGALDSAAPTERQLTIVNRNTRREGGKHPRTVYEIHVPSWRAGEGLRTFEVSAGEFANVRANRSKLVIQTMPGFLGYEWIRSRYVDVGPARR